MVFREGCWLGCSQTLVGNLPGSQGLAEPLPLTPVTRNPALSKQHEPLVGLEASLENRSGALRLGRLLRRNRPTGVVRSTCSPTFLAAQQAYRFHNGFGIALAFGPVGPALLQIGFQNKIACSF